jgi:hypothetical protein
VSNSTSASTSRIDAFRSVPLHAVSICAGAAKLHRIEGVSPGQASGRLESVQPGGSQILAGRACARRSRWVRASVRRTYGGSQRAPHPAPAPPSQADSPAPLVSAKHSLAMPIAGIAEQTRRASLRDKTGMALVAEILRDEEVDA